MRIYQLIDSDGEELGLLGVTPRFPSTSDELMENVVFDTSCEAYVKSKEEELDYFDEIISKLKDRDFIAERIFVEELVIP